MESDKKRKKREKYPFNRINVANLSGAARLLLFVGFYSKNNFHPGQRETFRARACLSRRIIRLEDKTMEGRTKKKVKQNSIVTYILLDGLLDLDACLNDGLAGLVHGAVQKSAQALCAFQRLRGNCNGKRV